MKPPDGALFCVLVTGFLLGANGVPAAPADHLVSHFAFDNPAQVADDTGSFDNDGTPVGDAAYTADSLLGDGALLLDGNGDLIELAGTGAEYTTGLVSDGDGFTLTCWAFVPGTISSDIFRFFSTYMSGGFIAQGWGAGHRSSDRLLATTYGIKDYDTVGGTAPPRDGWHHYAYVYRHDPISRIDYYVDRILVDSVTTGNTGMNPAPTADFAIGGLGLPTSLQYFEGRLDDLRIYDIELTASEIGTIYAEAAGFIYDAWARSYGLDPAGNGAPGQDPDLDGSTNQQEFERGTDPTDNDSDGDGLEDGVESDTGVFVSAADTGTDPLNPDSDGDTLSDGDEVNTHMSDPNDFEDPIDSDMDDDGLPNTWETLYSLDPYDDGTTNVHSGADGDPDLDGLPNRDEFHLGSSPTDNQDPDGRAWLPRPKKAHLLVIHAHPDDEGIFFGGLLPYATQTRGLNTILVNMVSDRVTINPTIREGELRDAAWQYGLRNHPVFARFIDHAHLAGGINSLNNAWDTWDGDDTDGVADDNANGIPDGREAGARYIAEQIRRYRPEVVATHDFSGEYGHGAHQASGLCSADAYTLAADPAVNIAGLPPWQARKIYIHNHATNPLFHDFGEAVSIDSNNDLVPDKTPRQVADEGLDFHVTQGRPDVSTVYRTGENFDAYPCEWWGLHASTVGDDTAAADFSIAGSVYSNWARGDFFEHLTVFPDSDSDGLPDAWELAHFPSLTAADPAGDDDNDGINNFAEFAHGLVPQSPDQPDFDISATGLSIEFSVLPTTGPGYDGLTRHYRLEYSPDILDWSTVVSQGVGDGTPLTYPIPPDVPRGFYRLVTRIE